MSDVSAESNDSVAITIDRPDSACSSCNSRESDAERSRANSRSNDAADANATDAAGANGADADGATATATATANAATPHGSGPNAACSIPGMATSPDSKPDDDPLHPTRSSRFSDTADRCAAGVVGACSNSDDTRAAAAASSLIGSAPAETLRVHRGNCSLSGRFFVGSSAESAVNFSRIHEVTMSGGAAPIGFVRQPENREDEYIARASVHDCVSIR